jgi:hypothetical protein
MDFDVFKTNIVSIITVALSIYQILISVVFL